MSQIEQQPRFLERLARGTRDLAIGSLVVETAAIVLLPVTAAGLGGLVTASAVTLVGAELLDSSVKQRSAK